MRRFGRSFSVRRKASDVLTDLIDHWPHERISLADIVTALGPRSYGLLMLVLALPALVPLPIPGISALFGIPLAVVAAQLVLGLPTPWLPAAVLQRSVLRDELAAVVKRALPYLLRIERVLHPRLPELTNGWGQPAIGAACTMLGVLLALPIPFTGIPLALPVVILSLAVFERDGAAALIGFATTVLGAGFALLLGWAFLKFILGLVGQSIGA